MPLFRQAIHHHFQQIMPWQVEKNSYRIAYQAASAAAQTLDLTTAAYLEVLREQLNTCRQLVSADAGVLEVIAHNLTLLNEATNRLPEPDRRAPCWGGRPTPHAAPPPHD